MSRHDFLSLGDEIDANAANGIPNGAPTVTNIAQRFTGQVRDRETAPALDYFQARYYSTAIARFTSVDPGKIQDAVNNALNTNSTYLGPTTGPGMRPMGYRNGAYNFNYFGPGVTNPVAGSNGGSGRFPGSGLHPLPGGADPTISPWGYNAAAGGSYFTAHFDSANPTDDLVSLLIHFFDDALLRRPHGC